MQMAQISFEWYSSPWASNSSSIMACSPYKIMNVLQCTRENHETPAKLNTLEIVFTWRHLILNLRATKTFIFIRHKRRYIYICSQFYSSITVNSVLLLEPEHLNFRVTKVCDTKLRSSLLKNIYLSHYLIWAFLEVTTSGKVVMWIFVCLALIISHLDSQSKFQMLFPAATSVTFFAPKMCTNMAFSYWAL